MGAGELRAPSAVLGLLAELLEGQSNDPRGDSGCRRRRRRGLARGGTTAADTLGDFPRKSPSYQEAGPDPTSLIIGGR